MSYRNQRTMKLPAGREHRLRAKHTLIGLSERTEQRKYRDRLSWVFLAPERFVELKQAGQVRQTFPPAGLD